MPFSRGTAISHRLADQLKNDQTQVGFVRPGLPPRSVPLEHVLAEFSNEFSCDAMLILQRMARTVIA